LKALSDGGRLTKRKPRFTTSTSCDTVANAGVDELRPAVLNLFMPTLERTL